MPTSKSAKKRMRNAERARDRNRPVKSAARTAGKALDTAVASGDAAKSKQALDKYFSALDKAAKKGVVEANTVSRRKSRASKKVAASTA